MNINHAQVNGAPDPVQSGSRLRSSLRSGSVLALTSALVLVAGAGAEEVKLSVLGTGAMQKLGSYVPQRLEMTTTKPEGIKKLPDGLTAPLFGEIKLGSADAPTHFYVVLDEPEGKPARLLVDANANGDLTDDPAAEWQGKASPSASGAKLMMYSGGVNLTVPYGSEKLELHLSMYRFDKHDPQRAALANTLLYYGDYARQGSLTLGGKTYTALLSDRMTTGDFRGKKDEARPGVMLFIDVNGDGKFDSQDEAFDIHKPFNIGGTTYEIADMTAVGVFQLVKSSQTVAETKPAPSLKAGEPALTFEAKTTDQRTINFPQSYKGKLVMLDFWATWCGPCVAELPHLTAAYEKFHSAGFEVLGISLDQKDAADKLAKFTDEKKMPWPQVYDGKFWSAEVAKLYHIRSIPSAFLVDGDTGKIIASGGDLRGERLAASIEKALPKKP